MNNVGVTLLNKAAFSKVNFNYPFFLSAIHMACNMAGASSIFWALPKRNEAEDNFPSSKHWLHGLLGDNLRRQALDAAGRKLILAFSIIFSLNIAIGNLSLKHVSVNFNQVMRSLVPAITIAMGYCLRKQISARRRNAVIPIVGGVRCLLR